MIVTKRLELIPASIALLRAAIDGPETLGACLRAAIPASWPPEHLDEASLRYTIDRLTENPDQHEWWGYFVLLRSSDSDRTLIGCVGYKGPPDGNGTVEVGYGITSEHRRKGYATEATMALIHRAFADSRVQRVAVETMPELIPSIGVVDKCGFHFVGGGSEPGVIRYELHRDERVKPDSKTG